MLKRMLAAAALSLCMAAQAGAATAWPEAPYSYYAENEDLSAVLRDFAGSFSLSLQAAPDLSGQVNGKFTTASPTEFLNRLGGVYGFNWFVHSGTLFVSPANQVATRTISAVGNSISALRDALLRLGVLDPRFGWGELPEQGIALVSGPPEYVRLVERTVDALPMGTGGQEVAVFRLKYASVNDRNVRYRDQEVHTPGLASVLRSLILGSGGGNNDQVLSAIAAPLRDNPPAFPSTEASLPPGTGEGGGAVNHAGNGANASMATGLRLRQPTVQADPRLNAIIVQDIPDRIPIYRELIAQLDQPSTLIEIEAMIVDVNSDLVNTLGVTWGANAGTSSFGYGDLSLAPSGGLPIDGGAGLNPGAIGVSVGGVLAARLHALETRGQANILSRPSILTADNMGALIDLSDTFYIQTRGERVATVTPVTVGTSLRVTPRYIEGLDGAMAVELTVDIEDGSIVDEHQIDGLPTVRKSNISTLAVVNNSQTLLIGGYNTSQDSQQVDKVPLLGDIPGLGLLFSNTSQTVLRRERLFLIRPRVVAINGEAIHNPDEALRTGFAINATWGGGRDKAGSGVFLSLLDRNQNTQVLQRRE